MSTLTLGGNAYLHWRLSRFFEQEGDEERKVLHLGHAVTAVNVALSLLPQKTRKGEGIAFYIGNAGKSLQSKEAFSLSLSLSLSLSFSLSLSLSLSLTLSSLSLSLSLSPLSLSPPPPLSSLSHSISHILLHIQC